MSNSNPIITIAAASVIIFSAVGVGVMTGLIPSSFSKPATEASLQAAATAKTPVAVVAPAAVALNATDKTTPKAAPKNVAQPAAKAQPKTTYSSASSNANERIISPAQDQYSTNASTNNNAKATVVAAICGNCGTIVAINAIEKKGEGSGLGAIAGGVLGGVLGHQVGGGTGKDIATIAGAAGGAYAGHQIEKNAKKSKQYDVAVRMEDGSTRNLSLQTEPAYRVGDKVKVVDGVLVSGY